MKYAIADSHGQILQAGNDETLTELPAGAIELTKSNFDAYLGGRHRCRVVNGVFTATPIDQAVIDRDFERERALVLLQEIDRLSIRGIREFLVAKFGDDSAMPAQLKQAERDAATTRRDL